jgi:DNA-binding transcriptional regulator YiaG
MVKEEKKIANKAFGKRFSEFVERYVSPHYNNRQYAKLLKTTGPSISNWMAGDALPTGDMILRMVMNHPNVNWFYIVLGVGNLEEPFISRIGLDKSVRDEIEKVKSENSHLLKEIENLREKYELARKVNELSGKVIGKD